MSAKHLRHLVILLTLGALALAAAPLRAQSDRPPADDDGPPPRPPRQFDDRDDDRPPRPERPFREGRQDGPERRGPMFERDRDRFRGGGDDKPLSPQELEERLELLKQVSPDLAQRIAEWKDRNPERVAGMIREHWPRLAHLMELKRTDPEAFELRLKDIRLTRQTMELVERYHQATRDHNPAQADEARNKLLEALREHFDIRQQVRERDLQQLQKRVGELREGIEARRQARDELINQRLNQLVGQGARAEW